MTTYVVPVDGSPFADRALRPAVALATRAGAGSRIVLLGCTAPHDPPVEPHLRERAGAMGDVVPVEVRILDDVSPVEGILQTLAETPDPVLCMATHGRGGLRAAVLGSVTEAIVCRAEHPVVLVGPCSEGTVLPGEHGEMVVCSDGSPFAAGVVPLAARWAEEQAMVPWLVEVVGPDEAVHGPDEPPVVEVRDAAQRRLDDLAAGWPVPGQEVQTAVLYGTPVSRAVSDFAADRSAAIIALATHGRSAIVRTALGSVATDIVRRAPCPVLLHRSTATT